MEEQKTDITSTCFKARGLGTGYWGIEKMKTHQDQRTAPFEIWIVGGKRVQLAINNISQKVIMCKLW
ncbi:MAG: hypothetical protein DRP64_03180 [Verrucomicrobia bacterium]|nr:MAG: hypothetical protein DRP64_03180 [Verrucomicrobiota bacterium]